MEGDWRWWKDFAEMAFYVVAIGSAIAAVIAYRQNSRLERARWVTTLFEKFYHNVAMKKICAILDEEKTTPEIRELVEKEDSEFTDYLNFFEYVAYLARSGQMRRVDVETLFEYYLRCMRRHLTVRDYIDDPKNSFEQLSWLLRLI
jgi:hypothetical protein